MKLTWDEETRSEILLETGLDLTTAHEVFAGVRFESPVSEIVREGEARGVVATIGFAGGQMVVVEWEAHGERRHVVAMRKANDREQKRFGDRLGALGRP